MANRFEGSHSPAYADDNNPFIHGWSSGEQVAPPNSAEMFASFPQYLQPSAPYAGHVRSTSVQSQPEMFTPLRSLQTPPLDSPDFFGISHPVFASHDKLMGVPSPMASAPLPTPSGPATLGNHDCTQFAFETLNSLYAPSESHPAVGDFKNTNDGLPALDVVLSTTKAAVGKLSILLDCSCSSNPHFSTTISLIITKILSWYQAIAKMNQQGEDTPLLTQMEAFTCPSMSLGAFRPEHEDTFRTNLILSELQRIEKLIDKFSERYCRAVNAAETGIEGSVYTALENLLRTRVRDTFKITMRTAPENIKRHIASNGRNRARVHTL